jgi:hypothetical protein
MEQLIIKSSLHTEKTKQKLLKFNECYLFALKAIQHSRVLKSLPLSRPVDELPMMQKTQYHEDANNDSQKYTSYSHIVQLK